jgi:hypothetical protein
MRRIVLGLIAILVSAYVFVFDTPALGPGRLDFHPENLSAVPWHDLLARRGLVCGFLAAAGLLLIVRGVDDVQDNAS